LIVFYGTAVAKYRYNPEAIPAAEAAHKKSQDEATAIAAEVQRLTAAAAPAEKQGEAGKALTDATAKKQAADAGVVATAARLKAAIEQATPRDTVDIVLSEPIAIRVKSAEAK
jgi:hypothetical protein